MSMKIARSFAARLAAGLCTAALCAACGGGGGSGGSRGPGSPTLAAGMTTLTLVAGSAGEAGNLDASCAAARFSHPVGIALDTAGNLYVADRDNCSIRKIATTGAVSTLAGSPQRCTSTDGAAGVAGFSFLARFDHVIALALDAAGTLYAADAGNDLVRKITPDRAVSTVAGAVGALPALGGLTGDDKGTLYAISGNAVVKITLP